MLLPDATPPMPSLRVGLIYQKMCWASSAVRRNPPVAVAVRINRRKMAAVVTEMMRLKAAVTIPWSLMVVVLLTVVLTMLPRKGVVRIVQRVVALLTAARMRPPRQVAVQIVQRIAAHRTVAPILPPRRAAVLEAAANFARKGICL